MFLVLFQEFLLRFCRSTYLLHPLRVDLCSIFTSSRARLFFDWLPLEINVLLSIHNQPVIHRPCSAPPPTTFPRLLSQPPRLLSHPIRGDTATTRKLLKAYFWLARLASSPLRLPPSERDYILSVLNSVNCMKSGERAVEEVYQSFFYS